jgi:GNAT superfamily N-acetyltransferase
VRIVRAQPADAPILSAIAWAAKAHWRYPTSWLEQWRDQLTITADSIATNETFAAVTDGQITGFYGLLALAEAMRLEHLSVLPDAMGRGIGETLFQHAAARARDLGFACLTIEADPNAEGFYLRMGAVRTGALTTEIEGQRRELPLLTYNLSS